MTSRVATTAPVIPGRGGLATAPAAPAPVVLDTSAVLAWLRGEPGAAVVDPLLGAAVMSAANWSET